MAKAPFQQQFAARLGRLLGPAGRGLAGEFVTFALSTMLYQGSRLAVSLVVAAWVGPEQFGAWNLLNLILLYGVVLLLGIPNGMNREVPLLRGRGDEAGARAVADAGFWFTAAAALAGGLLAGLWTLAGLGGGLALMLWCAALFALWQLHQYLQMRLKSALHFREMSYQQGIFALLLPLAALPLAWRWGVTGFIAGQALAFGAVCVYMLSIDPPAKPAWRYATLRRLFEVGWPIMLAGLLYSLLTSVDRWVILRTLGVEALGHYSLAILCVSTLQLFPAVISQQLYPRMVYRYGQTGDARSLAPMVLQQTLTTAAVSLPMLAVVALALPFLAERWLVDYAPGVVPAQILLVGLAAVALAGGTGNYLNTIGRQRTYLAIQAATIVVSVGLTSLLAGLGLGLNGVALGAAAAYLFFGVTMWAVVGAALWR